MLLYPDVEGDGAQPTKTPGKLRKANEVDRLEKVYENPKSKKRKKSKREKREKQEKREKREKRETETHIIIVVDETIRKRSASANGLAG